MPRVLKYWCDITATRKINGRNKENDITSKMLCLSLAPFTTFKTKLINYEYLTVLVWAMSESEERTRKNSVVPVTKTPYVLVKVKDKRNFFRARRRTFSP